MSSSRKGQPANPPATVGHQATLTDNHDMPTYAYRCRDCSQTFEVRRAMSESNAPATCPHGHADTVKLLSTVALAGSAASASAAPAGGGCCGGGCCN